MHIHKREGLMPVGSTETYLDHLVLAFIPTPPDGQAVSPEQAGRHCAVLIRWAATIAGRQPAPDGVDELQRQGGEPAQHMLEDFVRGDESGAMRKFAAAVIAHLFRLLTEFDAERKAAASPIVGYLLNLALLRGQGSGYAAALRSHGIDEPAWRPLIRLIREGIVLVSDVQNAAAQVFDERGAG